MLSILCLWQGRPYVMPTQQYPVQPGAAGFFPSASPTEYSTYGVYIFVVFVYGKINANTFFFFLTILFASYAWNP